MSWKEITVGETAEMVTEGTWRDLCGVCLLKEKKQIYKVNRSKVKESYWSAEPFTAKLKVTQSALYVVRQSGHIRFPWYFLQSCSSDITFTFSRMSIVLTPFKLLHDYSLVSILSLVYSWCLPWKGFYELWVSNDPNQQNWHVYHPLWESTSSQLVMELLSWCHFLLSCGKNNMTPREVRTHVLLCP